MILWVFSKVESEVRNILSIYKIILSMIVKRNFQVKHILDQLMKWNIAKFSRGEERVNCSQKRESFCLKRVFISLIEWRVFHQSAKRIHFFSSFMLCWVILSWFEENTQGWGRGLLLIWDCGSSVLGYFLRSEFRVSAITKRSFLTAFTTTEPNRFVFRSLPFNGLHSQNPKKSQMNYIREEIQKKKNWSESRRGSGRRGCICCQQLTEKLVPNFLFTASWLPSQKGCSN